MTALCGGGTSSSRPEFGEVVYVLPAALGAFLNNIPTLWAVGAAGYIGKVTFNLATFCSTDPPAVPTFTAQDVIDILNPYNPFTYTNAQQKFQDLVGAFMWHDLCRCDNGTVPSRPTPPAEPAGAPDINPPGVGPSYPTGMACQVLTADWHVTAPNGSTPGPGTTTLVTTGATSVSLLVTPSRALVTADGTGYQVILNCFNASGTFISNPVFYSDSSSGPGGTLTANLPSGTAAVRLIISVFNVASDLDVSAAASLFCGSSTNPGVPQPCPSDPFVQATLDQILALVTLIQRQNAPFAYVSGSTHSGLSGHGSVSVQGLLGMRIEVTDDGLNYSLETGDPDVLWNAGWVNWGNADGVTERQWISSSPFLTMPALAGQFTSFHYSLRPGVVIDATEISREP